MIVKIAQDLNAYLRSSNSPYKLVLLDPPWRYNDLPPKLHKQLNYKLVNCDYLLHTSELLKKRTQYLLVWTTSSFIYDVLKTFSNHFKYVQTIVWVKTTKQGLIHYGLGNYFRNSCEYILLFKQHTAKPFRSTLRNVFLEQSGARTSKPRTIERSIIESISSNGDKILYGFSGVCNLELLNSKLVNVTVECVDILL